MKIHNSTCTSERFVKQVGFGSVQKQNFPELRKEKEKKIGEAVLTSKTSWALWVVLAVAVVCCC